MSDLNMTSHFSISDIKPMPSRRPLFRNQEVIDNEGVYPLDQENKILLIHNILTDDEIVEYLIPASVVNRQSGKSGFGMKPRREICYSIDGLPYTYSRKKHLTEKYPEHVLKVLNICTNKLDKYIPGNKYTVLSTGVDIIYDNTHPLCGSISAHSDDEDNWGMVIILSLGQTRFLRVRNKTTKIWYNVEMSHNSMVIMYGQTFQTLYTHQVDKLHASDELGIRLSLNARYKCL